MHLLWYLKAINYLFLDFLYVYSNKKMRKKEHLFNDTIPHHFYNDSNSWSKHDSLTFFNISAYFKNFLKNMFSFWNQERIIRLPLILARFYKNYKVRLHKMFFTNYDYRTCATSNRGYYYFFLNPHVGFSLMIGGIPLKNMWSQNKSGY